MKALHTVVVILIIIGALNWGLVGAFDFNLVSAIFGPDTWITNLIYILVGLSALVAMFTEFAVHREHTAHPVRREPRPAGV